MLPCVQPAAASMTATVTSADRRAQSHAAAIRTTVASPTRQTRRSSHLTRPLPAAKPARDWLNRPGAFPRPTDVPRFLRGDSVLGTPGDGGPSKRTPARLEEAPACVIGGASGKTHTMLGFSARASGRDARLRQVAAWIGAAVVYGAAQGLSMWVARYAQGRGTRPQYEQFERPAFAPPGAVFPVVWSALNLTTATSAWLVWRADEAGPGAPQRRRTVLEWWALATIIRSGYVPLAFSSRRSGRPLQTRRCCAWSWCAMHPWPAGSIKPLPPWQFPRSRGPRSRPS